MQVFIPGGTGFLGTPVATLLASRGHRVVTAGRSEDADFYLDVNDEPGRDLEKLLKEIKPDVTLNLVGNGLSDSTTAWTELTAVNSQWPAKLAAALSTSTDSRLIHAASSTELVTDQHGNFESDYSRSRAEGTRALEELCAKETTPITIAFVHNTYGPTQPSRRLVKWMVTSALTGTPIHLAFPERVRDFIYVDDVAESLCQIVEGDEISDRVHIGTGRGVSLYQLAKTTVALAGADSSLITSDTPDYDPFSESVADVELLQRSSTVDIEEGVSRVVSATREANYQ